MPDFESGAFNRALPPLRVCLQQLAEYFYCSILTPSVADETKCIRAPEAGHKFAFQLTQGHQVRSRHAL